MKIKRMKDIIDKKSFGYHAMLADIEQSVPLPKKTMKQLRCMLRNGWLQIRHNPKRQDMKGYEIKMWNGKSWNNWI
jgi:hypothetical protein